jgi:hypothetical protein
MTYQRVVRTMAKNEEPNEEMRELIEESMSISLLNQLGALNRDRANETLISKWLFLLMLARSLSG